MLIATYRLCRLVRRAGHYLLNGALGHETPRNYHKNEFGNIKIEFPVLFSLHANIELISIQHNFQCSLLACLTLAVFIIMVSF